MSLAGFGLVAASPVAAGSARGSKGSHFDIRPSRAAGNLDCNGFSKIQKTILPPIACTDVRGAPKATRYTWNNRFYDNGHYIGHDEPAMSFFSGRKGSGNTVTWAETLPTDPSSLPTVSAPGSDVTHWFELSIAPWFGMALCDGASYPQLPCTPNSDANAPACSGPSCSPNSYPGGGSAFLEVQFYPPGDGPFADSISCNNTAWCASLHINELECTFGFVTCNNGCAETTNFAFIQRDGVPTGPPNPQQADLATSTPNSETLMMNPGDHLKISIFDAPAPAVPDLGIPPGNALEVSIDDLTTGQTGFMQASAANGYTQTSIANCNGQFFNYEPEYSTAKATNFVPWAALQGDINNAVEIGHFTPCTSVTGLIGFGAGGSGDPFYGTCAGPYENTTDAAYEDAPCWTNLDTHGSLASDPNEVAGCLSLFGGGDIDFDGTSYRTDWPTGASPTLNTPSAFAQSMPTSGGAGYPQEMFQTDTALSESTCGPSGTGCTVPPTGPEVDQPGNTSFYPFWSVATNKHGACTIEFGNNTAGVNSFGGDAQYGTVQLARLGYPEFEGKILKNSCTTG